MESDLYRLGGGGEAMGGSSCRVECPSDSIGGKCIVGRVRKDQRLFLARDAKSDQGYSPVSEDRTA